MNKSTMKQRSPRRNIEVATYMRRLHDYLIIGGYPERHAGPYLRLAHVIANHEVDIQILAKERRLKRIPGLGWHIERTIIEYLDTGNSSKFKAFARTAPPTVLDLLDIPGIGIQTARSLFQNFGISGPIDLKAALDEGWLQELRLYRDKLLVSVHTYLSKELVG